MAKANSSVKATPWLHKASGLWCIKRKGKRYYLGRDESEARARLNQFAERIARGLDIPPIGDDTDKPDLLSVDDILQGFLGAQEERLKGRDLSQRSFTQYLRSCKDFASVTGASKFVEDLSPKDFETYKADVSTRRNVVSTGNEVTRIKTVFKWAFESGYLSKPMNFGPYFRRPKKRDVRLHRQKAGPKTFEREEILALLDELGLHWRACVFLGINCGFGNSDCSALKLSEVDLKKGTIASIRSKTGEARFATLWPETVEALKISLTRRPAPTTKRAKDSFFVQEGDILIDEAKNDTDIIGKRVVGALQRLKLHTPGKSFYWLRHTFRTVADQTGDDTATRWIMGHTDDRIDRTYIHNAPVERIRAVTDYVRRWLIGGEL